MRQPYMLPDADCERLNRTEMVAVRMMLAALSVAAYAKEDLKDRLECVPDGNRRMRMAVGGLRAICDDLVGTISQSQCRQIHGTMKDFEMRLLPKLTPGSTNIIMTKDQGKELLDCARWKCHACVEDGERCRQCKLYQLLTSILPLDEYHDRMLCPYNLGEWAN